MHYSKARILVASNSLSDAKQIARLLGEEFDAVHTSVDELRMVEEFEQARPDVLVLAFRTLEESERYYLGLYRKGDAVHAHPHRTVILSGYPDMQRTYELCKQEYFDDYVLFWPAGNDAPRLCMSVIQAARRLCLTHGEQPSVAEFAAQARQISALDTALRSALDRGGKHLQGIDVSLHAAKTGASQAIADFSRSLIEDANRSIVQIRDDRAFSLAIEQLQERAVSAPLQRLREQGLEPTKAWVSEVQTTLESQSKSAQRIAELASMVRLKVLAVDDDEFQLRLLSHLLNGFDLDTEVCVDASTALTKLRSLRPDLIMVDLNLPDINGIELTRRIKSAPAFKEHNVVESLRAGAVDFVVKPFERERLKAKIQRFLPLAARAEAHHDGSPVVHVSTADRATTKHAPAPQQS
jgi:CheY-like chemotaxis protein